ncbi:MAG: FAD-dependent monooxygenase [Desulfocurvibacter africanus]
MIRIDQIKLSPDHTDEDLAQAACVRLNIRRQELLTLRVRKRSVDSRKRGQVLFIYSVDCEVRGEEDVLARAEPRDVSRAESPRYEFPAHAPQGDFSRPVIVGAGPCGLFAGLMLARAGFRPLLLERGKPARERARDVYDFWRGGAFDPGSNVQFGEGGAGTFSDGKLTTQIKDREGRIATVLRELTLAGAPEEILWQAKPHVGTDKLVGVVENLRKTIIDLGGEVRFQTQVAGLIHEGGRVRGVRLASGEELDAGVVVLAIGHSARDTFAMLHGLGLAMSQKPFSIGCRMEHPQALVDAAQYGRLAGHPRLPPAEYKLVHHGRDGRSAYTFCMCPGGEVIAAASETGGVVTNGMSRHARAGGNANSALLVGVEPTDLGSPHPLAGVEFQRRWERRAFELAGGDYRAPVQMVEDFLAGRPSKRLGDVQPTYKPGVTPTDLAECLPAYVASTMREAIVGLDRKLRGFARPDAVLTGVETRSSSPVRLVRGEDLQSVTFRGVYPAGEGAGYAGGIVSAAVDGMRAAEAVALELAGLSRP